MYRPVSSKLPGFGRARMLGQGAQGGLGSGFARGIRRCALRCRSLARMLGQGTQGEFGLWIAREDQGM